MASTTKYCIDWYRLRSPEMRDVLAEVPALIQFVDPAAAAVAVHAQVNHDTAKPVTTAITSPAPPRSVSCAFSAQWDAGDVVISGTDQFGNAQTETILANAGQTVAGVKIWKTITSITWANAGTDGTLDVATGLKIGLPLPIKYAWGMELCDGVAELATWDATYHAITMGTAPNGAHDYTLLAPIDWKAIRELKLY